MCETTLYEVLATLGALAIVALALLLALADDDEGLPRPDPNWEPRA